ncbi:guanylate kinase [Aspergillus campestris IBT 28561]|uniref:Guanylate kinase n=1 Tax=Aspergillus campestris (strain IBT 28561) TaxID=1392248 RepID=A0A2I1DGS4_ASPC2|nr:guanylate kinase [Aspergillus campestris IBT 28561]PKY09075.1 guanylate kinase [Aspergillus campestris IBT 28561]
MTSPSPSPSHQPIVISGPSGVGKGTLIQKLFTTHPNTFALTVSHTTREPRPGEAEGVAYHFVSHDTFLSLISQNAFVEHALFSGNHYGTSKQTIMDQVAKGLIVVLDIEMHGVRQMRENSGSSSGVDARYVFIRPPSIEALEARLRGRGTEREEDIRKRLAQARRELEYAEQGVHDRVIVNDDLDRAYKELEEFVFGSTL